MRTASLAIALLFTASPALASPHTAPRPSATDAVRALQEPLAQDAAAAMIDRLADIVLDTRVGPAAMLADPRDGVHPNDTLRDLKRRDDPEFERHLRQDTRRAVGTAAAVAGGVAAESAELKRTADRLQDALAPIMGMLAPQGDGPRYERRDRY